MRLFIAVDLPKSIRDSLKPLFGEKLPGSHWVGPEQLHLTLRFLGETDEALFHAVKTALAEVSAPNFELRLRGAGVFPNPSRARVLWVGLGDSPPLLDLQKQIENKITALGFAAETRGFSPHLTLARFKFSPRREIEAFLNRYRDLESPNFPVENFHLYSSRLNPQGAEHRIEASFPLSAN